MRLKQLYWDNVETDRGWAKPPGSTTFHYFIRGQSICRQPRTPYYGPVLNYNHSAPQNCGTCQNALARRQRDALRHQKARAS